MEREQAFDLARTLDERGFSQEVGTDPTDEWVIRVALDDLDRDQLAKLAQHLAESDPEGRLAVRADGTLRII
jgi:hypothetical protein